MMSLYVSPDGVAAGLSPEDWPGNSPPLTPSRRAGACGLGVTDGATGVTNVASDAAVGVISGVGVFGVCCWTVGAGGVFVTSDTVSVSTGA